MPSISKELLSLSSGRNSTTPGLAKERPVSGHNKLHHLHAMHYFIACQAAKVKPLAHKVDVLGRPRGMQEHLGALAAPSPPAPWAVAQAPPL